MWAPSFILFCAARVYLAAGRIEEATNYAREILVLVHRLGAPGLEAVALLLMADVAAASGAASAGGEVLLGLLAIAHPEVKFAETEVTVSDLRTHTAGLSEGQRLAAVVFAMAMYCEMAMTYWLEQAAVEARRLASSGGHISASGY
jgi:hypothetical protein